MREQPEIGGMDRQTTLKYLYYLLSTGKYKSRARWRAMGEPNPFAPRDYRADMTSRSELVNLFYSDK